MIELKYHLRRRALSGLVRHILADAEAVALELDATAHSLKALSVLTRARIRLPRALRHPNECATEVNRLRSQLSFVLEDAEGLAMRLSALSAALAGAHVTQQEEDAAAAAEDGRERRDRQKQASQHAPNTESDDDTREQ